MDTNTSYYRQVRLLTRILPLVAAEKVFALKGGTAINLFIRDMPRLSVDIDLVYLPMDDREMALTATAEALKDILPISLFLHCTEKSIRPASSKDWRDLMTRLGLTVVVERTGCCGMSGVFGHEKRHIEWSRRLFDPSWRKPLGSATTAYGARPNASAAMPHGIPCMRLLKYWKRLPRTKTAAPKGRRIWSKGHTPTPASSWSGRIGFSPLQ